MDHLSRRARWDYFNNGNPRLTVFIRPGGVIQWENVQVPDNLVVTDRRVINAPVSEKSGSAIRGTVHEVGSDIAVNGAEAVLWDASEEWKDRNRVAETTTDASGSFLFEGITPGNYYIKVSKEEYSTWSQHFIAPDWNKNEEFRIDLSLSGSVSGVVVDGAGDPISGVEVRAG